jgi:4-hydroxybenzoyl-CoA reductase subunit beta
LSLPAFKLLRARTVTEAVEFLGKYDDVKVVAGGTDLVPSMQQRLFTPEYVLDIRGIRELNGIGTHDGQVEIGALTPLSAIEHSPFLREFYPVLAQAAATVASPVLRNMGTLGGNVCLDTRCLWYNQSLTWRKSCGFCIKKDGDLCHVAPGGTKCWAAFSGDTPPALLCLDAELEIAGPEGKRRVPLKNFYINDGVTRMHLGPKELVTRVLLPESTGGWRGAYLKLRIRGSIDYPLAGVAVVLRMQPGKNGSGRVEDARVAVTAVNPAPRLVKGIEQVLAGKLLTAAAAAEAGELAARTAKPLTTSALTPEYRREIVRVYAKRALLAAARA